ncbi:MAG TPA: DUF2804 domain-containing protein [Chloroflexi bacterium]|nr:DUF2804 domain-containing protein [Chloroflexota bacterium]
MSHIEEQLSQEAHTMTNTQLRPEPPQRELQSYAYAEGTASSLPLQPLLDEQGNLTQIGWARQPLLDCNLEAARFYALRFLQRLRIKRWDYYGVTTPTHFYSFTLADLGYAGQVFAYMVDFEAGTCHEETLTLPLARGIVLPRNSTEGTSAFESHKARLVFRASPEERCISVEWPGFGEQGLRGEIRLHLPTDHESMVIVIPIPGKRFYYNRKINCLPAEGWIEYGGKRTDLHPTDSLGNLDWGRGVWEYRSFWVWASSSGFLSDGRRVGLNLGFGFGDTSAATENALILDGRVHKLGQVDFTYDSNDFMRPWRMTAPDGLMELKFVPFLERVAATNLLLIASQVHQMFGRYYGTFYTNDGEVIHLDGVIGFAEEHHARW